MADAPASPTNESAPTNEGAAGIAARARSSVPVRPLVRAAAVTAILSAIGAFVPEPPPKAAPASAPVATNPLRAVCGLRAIPEGDVCLPLPAKGAPLGPAEAARTPASAKDDAQIAFLPRRPDRVADHAAYVLPILGEVRVLAEGTAVERAAGERSGVDLASPRGERVMLAQLEGEQGDARVVFVGEDVGVTVATLHTVQDGDATRSYLVIYGHLDRPGPGIVAGMRVRAGEVVAFSGDTGSTGVEQLYLETRLVRDGALPRLAPDQTTVPKPRLADDALSIATDPRNVLAKKPKGETPP